ncbi:LysR family transcriptional regulator [Fundicoccus culcitae]|uniref:LysR family transcriptional regulator n=1 Tax=Fundicoccus culcitae TaxID=2969821 RepID=A0ABY5P233_9LACT|nr:LysR family transcriptional regulator [Fundicoccus culcitae]UUX32766.1 LysR family transcriptional regulator [Fundicoccus culcitae]
MHSRQTEVFIKVVEEKSFNKAAEKLFISPTAVMKQMNLLEDELGVILVKRSSQGVTLTLAGESYYDDAKQMVVFSQQAIQKARQIEADSPFVIRIGTSFLNPVKSFIPLWNQLNKVYPQFKLQVVPFEDDHITIMDTIKTMGSDFDFIVGACDAREWLTYCNLYKLGELKLSCAVPSNHLLADKHLIQLEDLRGETLMMVQAGNSYSNDQLRQHIEQNFPEIIIEDTPFYYDLEVFNRCEQTGNVLLTLDGWESIHPSLVTLPLDWDGAKSPYGLIYSKKASDGVKKFVKAIEGM